ncbi:RluA family pseudouridine synthase [Leptolyngbya sp. BL0902]|uniref:RluA family pseudouridine synthase n=1 Tax=Leptolyngbya sp. BL0902 TaxID=1115757 RepID=UPI001CEC215A|nr:RluA family pseudouridine synthase [Leptolyngbya sp. BL0902]
MTVLPAQPDPWDYRYEGRCPRTGKIYTLPRTALAKAAAQGLMDTLAADPQALGEGKMYGVLLVRVPGQTGGEGQSEGQVGVLKAFSGLWRGQAQRPGWVPPIPGREHVALLEAQTLDQLHRIKTRLQHLNALPERGTYAQLRADFDQQRQALNQRHRQRREERAQQRQHLTATLSGKALATALANLDQVSRGDKAELRHFKQNQAESLHPLAATIQAADAEMQTLKRQRRALSQQLQANMHAVYRLTNFAGDSLTLAQIQALEQPSGLPTGTGDCCAPKLLHYAAQHGWQPLALAEFWWGPPLGDRQSGHFYGACEERCQPILGFLLAGLSAGLESSASPQKRPDLDDLPILYMDDWLVVVDKPAGLLSVPGRYGNRQDSVLSRLQVALPNGRDLRPVHRLDQATSGVLVLARTADSHRHLSQQFAQRRVHKVYEALLGGRLTQTSGWIDLPLSPDPQNPPRQRVDRLHGKPSQTSFEVLAYDQGITRVAFMPHTGRTHQLRVHAAHPQGLNAPILGDALYGPGHDAQQADAQTVNTQTINTQIVNTQRLHLHAKALTLIHPHHQTPLTFTAPVPF